MRRALGGQSYEPDWAFHEVHAEERASRVLLLLHRIPERYSQSADTDLYIRCLETGRLVLPAADVAWALRTAAALPATRGSHEAMDLAARLASWCEEPDDPELREAAATLLAVVEERHFYGSADVRKRLLTLSLQDPSDGTLNLTMIRQDDGWSRAVLARAAQRPDPDGAGNLLLKHLTTATGSKPSAKWLARAAALLRDPGAAGLLRILVESTDSEPVQSRIMAHGADAHLLVSETNTELVRAACWSASALDADWVVPALHTVTQLPVWGTSLRARGYVATIKVPNAAVCALGLIASDAAIGCLLELQRTVKHSGFRTQINAAIGAAAQRAGLAPGELAEHIVPAAGLNANGERQVGTAWVSIGAGRRVIAEWETPAGRSPRAPADADAETVKQVKAVVKEVQTALAGERIRLEGLLAEDRSWPVADWRRLYLDHPVTRTFSRRIIWSFDDVIGLPSSDGAVLSPEGLLAVPADARVRLWHPARAGTAQVQRWRDYLVSVEAVQPFKQAFREVYLITPAELETRVYSNRFAAHILQYNQLYALFKERGWTANYLGPHDGGYGGRARRDFPDAGLTVAFDHFAVDMGDFTAPLCSSDRVSFYRTADRARTPVPLAQIPKMVFTEAMRDIDLFVAVTSIALDPRWADGGENPHLAYWRQASFGELSQTAVVRREALARIVPKLKIARQLELAGRYLRVRGKLNTYKIHIGSGNIRIEPDDRYLCIVPASGRSKVMLPFDGDNVLSLIVSKALMLAADDKITDPTITSQLPGRVPAPSGDGRECRDPCDVSAPPPAD
jgi:hypothetical protein